MQCRPRSNSAAGHSSGINHAAPTQHRWGKQLPLLGVGQGCSPALSSFAPPCVGTARHGGGLPGDGGGARRCPGRSQVPAEHPWVQGGSCQQRGRASTSVTLSCPAGGSCCPGVTAGWPGGHSHTLSLSSAGHLSLWLGSGIIPAPSSAPARANTSPRGEGDEPQGGFKQPHNLSVFPGASQHPQSHVFPHSSGPSSLPGQESSQLPCLSRLVTRPLPPALALSRPSQFSSCCHSKSPGCLPPPSRPHNTSAGEHKVASQPPFSSE